LLLRDRGEAEQRIDIVRVVFQGRFVIDPCGLDLA